MFYIYRNHDQLESELIYENHMRVKIFKIEDSRCISQHKNPLRDIVYYQILQKLKYIWVFYDLL